MAHLRLPVLGATPAASVAVLPPGAHRPRVHVVSLGCARNRVDAEHMLGMASRDGFDLLPEADGADAVVINTCSFIGEAKQESVDAILQFSQARQEGRIKSLVVTGCLAQRYSAQLTSELPEVDHFLGTSDYTRLVEVLQSDLGTPNGEQAPDRDLVTSSLDYLARYDLPRINTLQTGSAYLKISEGCDNTCAFCIIPKLRGAQRSRAMDDLVAEAQLLADQGVRELTLIAEDLTAYGHDLPGRPGLGDLLYALGEVKGIAWVRCMYAYPRPFKEKLIRAFTDVPNVIPYLDIPVQHASNRMLKLMRRGRDQERLTEMLLELRARIPNLVLRTTMIVGFPGETDEDFAELLAFVERLRFERLGVFRYSDEENTSAFDLADRVPARVKRSRWEKVMRRQRRISRQQQEALLGTEHACIVEGLSPQSDLLLQGRLWSQAPEIDGVTYISSEAPLSAGQMVKVRITQAHDYDLVGEVVPD